MILEEVTDVTSEGARRRAQGDKLRVTQCTTYGLAAGPLAWHISPGTRSHQTDRRTTCLREVCLLLITQLGGGHNPIYIYIYINIYIYIYICIYYIRTYILALTCPSNGQKKNIDLARGGQTCFCVAKGMVLTSTITRMGVVQAWGL